MERVCIILTTFLFAVALPVEIQGDQSVCTPVCPAKGGSGEDTIKSFHMTPLWLEAHASYISSDRSTSATQITFNAGSINYPVLLKVPLIAAGVVTDATPLTVEITVANDVGIGSVPDSDISYGVSDGSKFIGFHANDKGNYDTIAPCFGLEGVSGATLSSRQGGNSTPKPGDKFYPGQFVFTLKLDERWGSCYTAHDGGYVNTAGYNNRLLLSKGLTLEVYKSDKGERVGIRFIKVVVMKDS